MIALKSSSRICLHIQAIPLPFKQLNFPSCVQRLFINSKFLQVTSNLGLSGRQRRLEGSQCVDDKEDLAVNKEQECQTNIDYLKDQSTIMDKEFQTTVEDKVHTFIEDKEDHKQTLIIDMESQETMEIEEDQPNEHQNKISKGMKRNSFRLDYIKSMIKT